MSYVPTNSSGQDSRPSRVERFFSVVIGAFLGGIVGLFFGIGLACFGLTMWLWLVIPLTTATLGGLIALKNPIDFSDDQRETA